MIADDGEVDGAVGGGLAVDLGEELDEALAAFADAGDGGAVDGVEVEGAGHGEHGVADGFGVEAALVHAPAVFVVGVDGVVLSVVGGAHLVGAAEHDLFDEFFDGPAVFHEGEGEVVEEFGEGGFHAHEAEVVGGGDDGLAHEVEPDAVGHDAGGERVVLGGDEEGEVEAAGAFGDVAGFVGGAEDFDEAAGDDVGLLIDVATDEEGAVDGRWAFEDAHGEDAGGAVGVEEVEVGLGGGGAVAGLADAEEGGDVAVVTSLLAHGHGFTGGFFGCLGEGGDFLFEAGDFCGGEFVDGGGLT